MKFPPFFLVLALLLMVAISVRGYESWSRLQAATFICQLVQDRAMVDAKILKPWSKKCFKEAERSSYFESRADFFARWQNELDQLKVSHLRLYTPVEQNELWTGTSLHNGVQLEWVDGHAVVVHLWPRSAAADAGMKLGDRVLVNELDSIQREPGNYRLVRDGKEMEVSLKPTKLQYSYPPRLHDLYRGIFHLEASEFRSNGFSQSELRQLLKPLVGAKGLILDLRWNRGGNLVAGLRLARFLTCTNLDMGMLTKTKGKKRQMQLPDSLRDEDQLKVFAESKEVVLKVVPDSPCYRGPLVVLVNYATASVAEIIAEGLRDRPNTKILGGVTAGDALMGVWYDLEMFGDGSMISVPEAAYQSRRGRRLEGIGVQPDEKLFWDTDQLERGHDSWIRDSQEFLLNRMKH